MALAQREFEPDPSASPQDDGNGSFDLTRHPEAKPKDLVRTPSELVPLNIGIAFLKPQRSSMRILLISGYASAILILGTFRGELGWSQYFDLEGSETKLLATVAKLKKENTNLESEIDKIEHSPEYALKILRDRYHITGENESIIFFSDE